jgi:hypothetical protein
MQVGMNHKMEHDMTQELLAMYREAGLEMSLAYDGQLWNVE